MTRTKFFLSCAALFAGLTSTAAAGTFDWSHVAMYERDGNASSLRLGFDGRTYYCGEFGEKPVARLVSLSPEEAESFSIELTKPLVVEDVLRACPRAEEIELRIAEGSAHDKADHGTVARTVTIYKEWDRWNLRYGDDASVSTAPLVLTPELGVAVYSELAGIPSDVIAANSPEVREQKGTFAKKDTMNEVSGRLDALRADFTQSSGLVANFDTGLGDYNFAAQGFPIENLLRGLYTGVNAFGVQVRIDIRNQQPYGVLRMPPEKAEAFRKQVGYPGKLRLRLVLEPVAAGENQIVTDIKSVKILRPAAGDMYVLVQEIKPRG